MPKTLWCLWLLGWDQAPPIVLACLATWRRLNPDWTLHTLTFETLERHIELGPALRRLAASNLPPEALSNIIRLELLLRHGGVWADATLYCLRSLDGWLPGAVPAGFFAFDRPGPDRMLSSWFLAAEQGSPVVAEWLRRCYAYWENRTERHTYFWLHGLFRQAYDEDPAFRAAWDATPRLSADGPHAYVAYDRHLFRPVNDSDRLLVETARTPMLKLSHKNGHDLETQGTLYRWLCNRVAEPPAP